ncbi:hypothetical protein HHL11_24450 [Ramlibacter sp. G-1-2-2]|uniref:Hpt domain-containing protein n=1 Tax=Ramlibacter agri TaxID=2728837 RepID=A0A848HBP1_9BURK|nr:hypothetical protein [Ramlibacter agri]NML46919.1 hypothetical protein [Ramlibacter agri]
MTAVQHGRLGPARLRDNLDFDANAVQAFFMGDDRGYLEARVSFIEQTAELLFDLQVAQEAWQRQWPHLQPYERKRARLIAFEIGRSAGLVGANRLAAHCRVLRDFPDGAELRPWVDAALQALRDFVAESELLTS